MSRYVLRVIRTPQRVCFQTLIDSDTGIQPILVSLWADHLSSSVRPNTAKAYLKDITCLLEWAKKTNIHLADRFQRLEGLTHHEIRLLAESLHVKADGSTVRINTYNRRLISIVNFINFHMERCLESCDKTTNEMLVVGRRIQKINKYFGKLTKSAAEIGLDETPTANIADLALERLLKIAHPLSKSNPYRYTATKIRNYCMILVSIECLLRRSELVLLELNDFEDTTTPTLRVKQPSYQNQISTKDFASLKTHGRVLPISRETASWLQSYVEDFRVVPSTKRHLSVALFISLATGKRLSTGTANAYLKPLQQKYFQIYGDRIEVHSHMLRVTGANLKKRAAEEKLNDLPALTRYMEVNEVMTYSGGWSPTSSMPRRYTRDHIASKTGPIARSKKHDH
ncbi:tyrosine-type recombinase/integrase [Stutzerimonas nitrititolerans]|uniref:tyrosine-type recombinase/integrase n=1 Tax=Stutzerimonas nitrititolerans TaxID=2482751 RepID=UPI0028B11F1D|nr:site-specific integrase [Stutzerimonas nitrititolerans]